MVENFTRKSKQKERENCVGVEIEIIVETSRDDRLADLQTSAIFNPTRVEFIYYINTIRTMQ